MSSGGDSGPSPLQRGRREIIPPPSLIPGREFYFQFRRSAFSFPARAQDKGYPWRVNF